MKDSNLEEPSICCQASFAMAAMATRLVVRWPTGVLMVLVLSLGACVHDLTRNQVSFTRELKAGERFEHRFGEQFIFALEPSQFGWLVAIYEPGRSEDLARLTPPFHFVPNAREIDGWHFRNQENTGPNDGSVNAPQKDREFVFSPEVGRSIDSPRAKGQPTREEMERIKSYGRGVLSIESLKLSPPQRGRRAQILEIRFCCTVSWPHRMK